VRHRVCWSISARPICGAIGQSSVESTVVGRTIARQAVSIAAVIGSAVSITAAFLLGVDDVPTVVDLVGYTVSVSVWKCALFDQQMDGELTARLHVGDGNALANERVFVERSDVQSQNIGRQTRIEHDGVGKRGFALWWQAPVIDLAAYLAKDR
jgi:hypothetical protein